MPTFAANGIMYQRSTNECLESAQPAEIYRTSQNKCHKSTQQIFTKCERYYKDCVIVKQGQTFNKTHTQ